MSVVVTPTRVVTDVRTSVVTPDGKSVTFLTIAPLVHAADRINGIMYLVDILISVLLTLIRSFLVLDLVTHETLVGFLDARVYR